MNEKLLTVIVPSYNMEAYLPKCLGSLVVPDGSLLERLDVLVVNDGSKDRTSQIAHGFERQHPGVFRVIDKPNGNYGSCINAALPVAAGMYVKILDADDSVATDGLTALLETLRKESETDAPADMVVTDVLWVNPNGETITRVSYRHFPVGTGLTLAAVPSTAIRFMMHSIAYRTKAVRAIGYHQTEGMSYTDLEWMLEPTVAVNRVTHLPVPVTRYLYGRAGQTMEADTYAKRYGEVIEIAKGLVSRYETRLRQCSEQSRPYYEGQLTNFLFEVYANCIYGFFGEGWRPRRVQGDLSSLDRSIRSVPSLFAKTEAARYPSTHVPLRLMRAWRRHPGRGTPALILFWAFLRIKVARRHFRHSLRNNDCTKKRPPLR